MQLFSDIAAMLSAPFVGDLDMKHLFLLIGFVLIAIAVWVFIIHTLTAVTKEAL